MNKFYLFIFLFFFFENLTLASVRVGSAFKTLDRHIANVAKLEKKEHDEHNKNEAEKVSSTKEIGPEQFLEDEDGLFHFSQGVIFVKDHEYGKALEQFKKAGKFKNLQNYLNYYKAYSHFYLENYKKAAVILKRLSRQKGLFGLLRQDVNFLYGKTLLKRKQPSLAYRKLKPLIQKYKRKEKRVEILNLLAESAVKKRLFRRDGYCEWVRALYSRYPSSKHSIDWDFEPKGRLDIGDKKAACYISYKLKKKRLRRLFRLGLEDKIFKDLTHLKDGEDKVNLFIDYHYFSGNMNAALNLALNSPHRKNTEDYVERIIKIQYYAGKYEDSLKTIKTQLDKSKNSRKKARYLYKYGQGLLSLKRFDEAEKSFSEIIKKHKGSSYYYVAKWFHPWSLYLGKHYDAASKGFEGLLTEYKRHPSKYSKVRANQIEYWMSRSYEQAGNLDKAVQFYREMSLSPLMGYYGILSSLRLESIAKQKIVFTDFINIPWKKQSVKTASKKEKFWKNFNMEPLRAVSSIDEEAPLLDEADPDMEFNEKKLLIHNERLTNYIRLSRLGLQDLAAEELGKVVNESRGKVFKNKILSYYERAGNYEKVSKLALRYFRKERFSSDLSEAEKYWGKVYPKAYKANVLKAVKNTKVSPYLVWSIMKAESFFDKNAQSGVGAKGLLQLMPRTAYKIQNMLGDDKKTRGYINKNLFLSSLNIKLGAGYLDRLSRVFSGKTSLVSAAYNAGPHRVKMWSIQFGDVELDEFIERVPYKETKNYIKKVLRHAFIYKNLYEKKPSDLDFKYLMEPIGYKHRGRFPTSENWGAI